MKLRFSVQAMLLPWLLAVSACSEEGDPPKPDIPFLTSDGYFLIGGQHITLPMIALRGPDHVFALSREEPAKTSKEILKERASNSSSPMQVDSLDLLIHQYEMRDQHGAPTEICPPLTRLWAQVVCRGQQTGVLKRVPEKFDLLDRTKLDLLKSRYTVGGEQEYDHAIAETGVLKDAHLEFGKVGSDIPLCQALFETARKRLAANLNQCSAPVPTNDARFGRISWESLQPEENIELLKHTFAWSVVNGNWIPESQKIARELDKGPPINEALVQDIWDKYQDNYADLIHSGSIRLERAEVELVPGTSRITVYRTDLFSAPNQSGNSNWTIEQCSETGGQPPAPKWRLFYEYRSGQWEEFINLNHWVFGSSDLIEWAGRAYQIDLWSPAGFIVPRHDLRGNSIFAGRALCVVDTIWE